MPVRKLTDEIIPAVQWSPAILPVLNDGHLLRIPLSGRSMYPLLSGGRDEAVLSSILGKKLKRGDIVLYVSDDGVHALHRIHHIKNNGFYMLGDAQTWIEGPIKRENILAVAEAVIRKGSTISCRRLDYRIISNFWLLARPIRPRVMRIAKSLYHLLKI